MVGKKPNLLSVSLNEWNIYKIHKRTHMEIEKYLKQVDFDGRLERGEYFSNKELRELLLENLEKYFEGEKDQDFVIELGIVFYPEIITSTDEHNDSLMTSVCLLTDLACNYKSAPKTKKGRDRVLLSILELLRKDRDTN